MTRTRLNTTDPQQLIYENGLLRLTVLGGIRLEGLDRMRAALKVELRESPRPPFRHPLDLYNDHQVGKFIRQVSERLEVGSQVVAASVSELTEELEGYRLEKLKEMNTAPARRPLSEAARAAATSFLKEEHLNERTAHYLAGTGIIGEGTNALILWYAMTSRKMSDPLSVICLAKSGTGKSYLQEKVAACLPEEEVREQTQFTGASFYHFKRDEIRGKVFLIEDMDGAQSVLFPIRELQTKKRISKTTTIKDRSGELRTVTLMVEGPVSVIGSTTREQVYEDNANRALLIHLDGSREQDERVMGYQKNLRAGLIDKEKERVLTEELRAVQEVLEPVGVVNPYAPLIELPKEMFKPRRALPLLLNFIEAITFYHQYQREKQTDPETGEVFIKSSPEDVELGFLLLRDVMFRKSDELSGAAREFFFTLKRFFNPERLDASEAEKNGCGPATPATFGGREVREFLRINPRTLNRYLGELTEYGLLEIVGGNKHKTGYRYRIRESGGYEAMQASISTQVEEVLAKIRAAHAKEQNPRQAAQEQKHQVSQEKKGSKRSRTVA